jgi:hypothetical protein
MDSVCNADYVEKHAPANHSLEQNRLAQKEIRLWRSSHAEAKNTILTIETERRKIRTGSLLSFEKLDAYFKNNPIGTPSEGVRLYTASEYFIERRINSL